VSGVVVRGIDPSSAGGVVDVERHMASGRLDGLAERQRVVLGPEEGGGSVELSGIVVGQELARQLGLAVGDVVSLVSPLGTPGPAGMVPRVRRFVLAGTFDSGMYDYDTTLAYLPLAEAQRFFDLKEGVSAIEIRVADVFGSRRVARAIEKALGGFPFRARDWMEINRNLFSALELEKVVYGIVLCLIVVVAAFNILASLTMVVKEKRRDIAILKAMGAPSARIARIFILNGTTIGLVGTALGSALGIAGCWLLARYKFIELPKDVFLVTTVPVHLDPLNFAVVAVVSVLICVFAALSPARRAASLVPVEVIRYE
jgi:lipoprotein-releasing system permease protein